MTQKILVVDDDEALAENIAEIVASLGVLTQIARDRKSALALASGTDFDVAMIDVRLPDGSGMSLLDPLRSFSQFTQAVLITGNATVEDAVAAVGGAAFAYVLKPFSPPALLETVRRALERASLFREQDRLRAELERSEQRHREVVESIPAFVLALDDQGNITTWNRQLETVTGYTRQEVLGSRGPLQTAVFEGIHDLPMKAGGVRKVRWSRAQVSGASGRPIVYAIGTDVTDEAEMLRRTLRAERLAAVGTMAAGLAHEVRNPLNSASLQLTLLERRLQRGDGPDNTLPVAGIIKSEIERLDRLVSDFLAFSRPRPLEARAVDARELLATVSALIAPELEVARVVLSVEAPAGIPPLAGDPERLRQVLLNLTRNAVEAMQERGGQLIVRARQIGDTVEIDVQDDGPGFSDELPVFDAFFTTKTHGTGLGLSLVHRIVADHGGSIRVQSRPGRTCFTVAIPIVTPAP